MDKQKRRLGDVAFVAHEDGRITRTIVSMLGQNDSYGLLEHPFTSSHFEFADAVAEVTTTLKQKEQELNAELDKVRAQLALVGSAEYKEQVTAGPFKRTSGSILGAALGLDGEVREEEMPVPDSYLEPGQRVFCVITPNTHNMMIPHYRPYTHFVLESTVREVQLMTHGRLDYRIYSYYSPQDIFADLHEAKKNLIRIFAEETGGVLPYEKIKLVSQQEEKEVGQASTRKIMETVGRQFSGLSIDD